MARRARHFLGGATYHVMLRGNNGQAIFSSDAERCKFCLLLQEGVERYGHKVLAFCFMSNHVHLVFQVNNISLSKICQNIAFRYAQYYNRKHGTIGHLFQGRFKSILVDSTKYLKELIRYIHLNPVRAKMVDDPSNYSWSSHQAYLMNQQFVWLSREEGLQFFGESNRKAMELFHHFVLSGIDYDDEIDFKNGLSEGILGDDVFIKKIQDKIENLSTIDCNTIDLKTLISVVTNWYDIDPEILTTASIQRKISHIRGMTALLTRHVKGVSLRELEKFFGRSESSMSQAAARQQAKVFSSQTLKNEFESLKAKLYFVLEKEIKSPFDKLSNCQV